MGTKTFNITQDSNITLFGGTTGYGNGASVLMCAAYDTGTASPQRMLLKFALDWSGISNIHSAVLNIKSGNVFAYHNPLVIIQRNTTSWAEGTYVNGVLGISESNAVTWSNKPDVTTDGQCYWNPGTAHNSWNTVDITDIVQAWAPSATVAGGGDQDNFGITIMEQSESSNYYNWDAFTRESGNGAYIVVTYDEGTPAVPDDDWLEITGDYYPWEYYANLYKGQCEVWAKGLQTTPIDDQALSPSSDCFASLVELRALKEVIPIGTILPLALQRIDNNSNQITYYKPYTSDDTITTSQGYKKFEPGGYFSSFGVCWEDAPNVYTTFFDDDCAGCYPDGFNFGILDHRNNMVFQSDKTSGNITMSGGL